MALQIDGRNEINVRIKVVGSETTAPTSSSSSSSSGGGVVVAESKRVGATWVVLDRQLKQEEKHCVEELRCNVVVIKGSGAKVMRLNLGSINNKPLPPFSLSSSQISICSEKFLGSNSRAGQAKTANSPVPILEDAPKKVPLRSAAAASTARTTTMQPSAKTKSSFFVGEHNPLFEKLRDGRLTPIEDVGSDGEDTSESIGNSGGGSSPSATPATAHYRVYRIPQSKHRPEQKAHNCRLPRSSPPAKTKQEANTKYAGLETVSLLLPPPSSTTTERDNSSPTSCAPYSSDVREAVSLLSASRSVPPPLCSLCRHKAPVFGKPPQRFSYSELEVATGGFADAALVAEGASGCVHRGVLQDGRVVAVKQLKGRPAEEEEFREEVEVVSRAQHRNVVMLVGFCVEGASRRALVFEYICNGSLDRHLYGEVEAPLDWLARMKIAVGVARGLRYLHEDCRVGFVVHKDMRPNNILLTHDFEPLLGDFRLTTWQKETSLSVNTNLPEAFGYLAPEFIEHGIVTDKSDVYAFGVVLLELLTGRKALDTNLPKGQQFLVEWARPLLSVASDDGAVDRFFDSHLERGQGRFFREKLRAMARAASLCLRREPQSRPGMSKVLRILEGDSAIDQVVDVVSTVGSRSGRMVRAAASHDTATAGSLSYRFPRESVINALCSDRNWPPSP
ncbi:inactive protein kinase SELMODRAFT_444075-like isoform X2 [Zingiber officinale]|nr:inactive protein kinase SELMODRAFT_444075-like isoform X2 [Zingiber officinale]